MALLKVSRELMNEDLIRELVINYFDRVDYVGTISYPDTDVLRVKKEELEPGDYYIDLRITSTPIKKYGVYSLNYNIEEIIRID
jgi:hypothetical protein